MVSESYCLDLGGLTVHYSFLYPETASYFKSYLNKQQKLSAGECSNSTGIVIRIDDQFIKRHRWLVDSEESNNAFIEFQCLMLATGNELLLHQRALFHGVALLWKERAWIITAPSGAGKTTQLRHWKKVLNKEINIINGDKPLIRCHVNGSVLVCSSPWKGKEGYGHRGLSAVLGGIILLEQGSGNQIKRIDPSEAAVDLFSGFISFPDSAQQLNCQAEILTKMLDAAPVWKLTNTGDESSAVLTIETLNAFLDKEYS